MLENGSLLGSNFIPLWIIFNVMWLEKSINMNRSHTNSETLILKLPIPIEWVRMELATISDYGMRVCGQEIWLLEVSTLGP